MTGPIPIAQNVIRPVPGQSAAQSRPAWPIPPTPPPPPRAPGLPSPPSPIPQPVTTHGKSGKATWIVGTAVAGFIFLVIKMATGSSGSGTRSATTSYPTYFSTPGYQPGPATSVPSPTPRGGLRPAGAVTGLDPNNDECDAGFSLTNTSGWAAQAVRGSVRTSCVFTRSILSAYWDQYSSPSKDRRTVYAAGSVGCSSVPGADCTTDDRFVVTCQGSPYQDWITCTGGSQAVVYLY